MIFLLFWPISSSLVSFCFILKLSAALVLWFVQSFVCAALFFLLISRPCVLLPSIPDLFCVTLDSGYIFVFSSCTINFLLSCLLVGRFSLCMLVCHNVVFLFTNRFGLCRVETMRSFRFVVLLFIVNVVLAAAALTCMCSIWIRELVLDFVATHWSDFCDCRLDIICLLLLLCLSCSLFLFSCSFVFSIFGCSCLV